MFKSKAYFSIKYLKLIYIGNTSKLHKNKMLQKAIHELKIFFLKNYFLIAFFHKLSEPNL